MSAANSNILSTLRCDVKNHKPSAKMYLHLMPVSDTLFSTGKNKKTLYIDDATGVFRGVLPESDKKKPLLSGVIMQILEEMTCWKMVSRAPIR